MKSAGYLIGVFVEFAAGVKYGKDNFEGAFALFGHDVYGDAASVVLNGYAAVLIDGDADVFAVAGKGFVDGVIYDFVDEVMQSTGVGASNVHCRPFADGGKSFENGNVGGIIVICHGVFGLLFPGVSDARFSIFSILIIYV